MKISVVIPAYNAAASIEAAIHSCLGQTHPAHEIIVVDDASTDNTVQIANQFKEVTLISLPHNSGPSAARNKGWDAATGDIIAFLDADDTWTANKLSVISKVFSNNNEIKYLGHPYTLNPTPDTGGIEITTLSYASIVLKNPFQPSCISLRRELKERFDESYRYCEDHELSIHVASKHTCHWLNASLTILGRPQLSTGGASANIWKMRKGELRLYSSIHKHNILFAVFIPFLWLYSLLKMAYRFVSR